LNKSGIKDLVKVEKKVAAGAIPRSSADFVQVSISSTFYLRTFFPNILVPKKFKPKTQLCNFWCQNLDKKRARVKR